MTNTEVFFFCVLSLVVGEIIGMGVIILFAGGARKPDGYIEPEETRDNVVTLRRVK